MANNVLNRKVFATDISTITSSTIQFLSVKKRTTGYYITIC